MTAEGGGPTRSHNEKGPRIRLLRSTRVRELQTAAKSDSVQEAGYYWSMSLSASANSMCSLPASRWSPPGISISREDSKAV